ncbi:MAG: MotA/TolQ/ExbB proton channel family protein [Candidatus Omnitrophica bacterium]|nr:MotA/TolQ/ExbB proton channel family protein [Candidatus Omnitrophota bacterium]
MDFGTIIGISTGFFLIITAIVLGGNTRMFVNYSAFMITVGGMTCATFISFPLRKLVLAGKIIRETIVQELPTPEEIIEKVVFLVRLAHKEGKLALEHHIDSIDYYFLKKGVQFAIDNVPIAVIADILNKELMISVERRRVASKILTRMGAYAPAFGMIGTLIGLIQMLYTIDNPAQIGTGMAVALLTTFYGALMANLVFLPMAAKLQERIDEEKLLRMLIIEGIAAIQSTESAAIIKERLFIFLNPEERQSFHDQKHIVSYGI